MKFPGFSSWHRVLLRYFVLWFFMAIKYTSLAVPGIVALFLLPLSGAVSSVNTYKSFANSTVFFVLSAMILASPIMRSGLSSRIAVSLIARFGKGRYRILFSIFMLSAASAFVISEHAVAAMMFPIVLEIVNASKINQAAALGLGVSCYGMGSYDRRSCNFIRWC